MPAIRTARQRARTELTAEIQAAARRQIDDSGAAALSLRAVARELGMASSALYRYFPSRDHLLTALIVDSYAALARSMRAADPGGEPRARWLAVGAALRRWAVDHPHEYALLYGTPVPGYRAPADTVQPAAEVLLALLDIVRDAAPELLAVERPVLDAELTSQLAPVAATYAEQLPLPVVLQVLQAFAQLAGAITLELFGHFVGSVDPAGPFYALTVADLADRLGLPG